MSPSKPTEEKDLVFFNISGINFPTKKRDYLMKLLAETADVYKPKFVIVAGGTIDGKTLGKEFKEYVKDAMREEKNNFRHTAKKITSLSKDLKGLERKAKRAKSGVDKQKLEERIAKLQQEIHDLKRAVGAVDLDTFRRVVEDEFIGEHALELSKFLPVIPSTNYHIVISYKIYDREIGVRILEKLRDFRSDIRLIGKQDDGTYDPEPKIPGGMKGFEEIRVVVPHRAPWFARIITALMQTLINRFVPRTFSPPPQMIVVGCTGTASYLPFYEGVPCISAPALHKLEEQTSTENMVGISIVKVIPRQGLSPRIVVTTEDFRPAIYNEKQFAIPSDANRAEKAVLNALIQSDASFKIVLFRIKEARKKRNGANGVEPDKIKATLDELIKSGMVKHDKKSNRYAINESLRYKADISRTQLFAGSRTIKQTIVSCFHVGCLKSLYHTALNILPELAAQSDTFVENGDPIQGIAHNYEYNGELLPTAHGYDRQEILAAAIRTKNILDIFRLKYAALPDKNIPVQELLDKCLIRYIYNIGNHPAWQHYSKAALLLYLFETKTKEQLLDGLLHLCEELKISDATYDLVKSAIEQKIVRVGESKIVNLNGTVVGIKHPFKGRTQNKSHRIQDVVDFFWRIFQQFAKKLAKKAKGFALAEIANFHECAAVHVVKFGRTVFGVMTGAYLHDTSFESHMDKVVDWGSANISVTISPDDRLLSDTVEFNNDIHPDDERIVLADRIATSDVLALCDYLNKLIDLPWR